MSDTATELEDPPPKKSRMGLIIGLVLAIVGGGAGYFVTSSGMLAGGKHEKSEPGKSQSLAFIPIEPMTISMGSTADRRFLRFSAQLEVQSKYSSDVKALLPRVVDVLNTYLRSISMADIEDPSALLTLRAQMRRRIDLVVGGDKVNDLLVMEFVVN